MGKKEAHEKRADASQPMVNVSKIFGRKDENKDIEKNEEDLINTDFLQRKNEEIKKKEYVEVRNQALKEVGAGMVALKAGKTKEEMVDKIMDALDEGFLGCRPPIPACP